MSRQTQHIGLNWPALAFVDGLKRTSDERWVRSGTGAEVLLKSWEWREEGEERVIQEVIQEVLESSGPVIFTCLSITNPQEGKEETPGRRIFQWVTDPTTRSEIDYSRGRHWVYACWHDDRWI